MKNTGIQIEGKPRILINYKGQADMDGEVQDDSMLLILSMDSKPEHLAEAVINFPVIDGEKRLFIHELSAFEGESYDCMLLDAVERLARKMEYDDIYINTKRQDKDFLKEQGFQKVRGKIFMAKRTVNR